MIHSKLFGKKSVRNRKAVSPAVSTVILTGTMVALISVSVVFVNSFLWTRIAESDFNSAKQFMQTMGLQIDDVAWTVGRKGTVRYSSTYGTVDFVSAALNYSVYIKTQGSGTFQYLASYQTGVLMFKMPVSYYSVTDGYYELLYPRSASNLTFTGPSAPVARVFAVEKLTPAMVDGSFARVAVAPTMRALFSNMTTSNSTIYYTRLYLPVLTKGSAHGSSQSVTFTGNSVAANSKNRISSIKVTVDFPTATRLNGFDASFFNFPTLTQQIDVPAGYGDAVLELYTGLVTVELGVHS
jgi:hypothetical protein